MIQILCVLVITLSTQDNVKLLEQLKSGLMVLKEQLTGININLKCQ